MHIVTRLKSSENLKILSFGIILFVFLNYQPIVGLVQRMVPPNLANRRVVEAQGVVNPDEVCIKEQVNNVSDVIVDPIEEGNVPPQDYKIAFVGDTGSGDNFQDVLDLISSEGADLVLHQGDMDYIEDEAGSILFQARVLSTLPDTPYLGSDGNHDNWEWYIDFFNDQLESIGKGHKDVTTSNYTVIHHGIRFVFSEEGGNDEFIDASLRNDDQLWKICSWHKNQTAMQVGNKNNGQGWGDYEVCQQYGAIIATAHEHSYSRTRTLSDVVNQIVDVDCGAADEVCVEPGMTFVFVNGLGGKSIRTQQRCFPSTFPYGCNGEWASIYSADQGAEYGVLFIEFYVDGNPNKASAYFKNISGTIIDQFTITSGN